MDPFDVFYHLWSVRLIFEVGEMDKHPYQADMEHSLSEYEDGSPMPML